MAHALGLGIVAWSPLGGGLLTGKYRQGEKGRKEGVKGRVFQDENSTQRTAILDTLLDVAKDAGVTAGEIAIAWVAQRRVRFRSSGRARSRNWKAIWPPRA